MLAPRLLRRYKQSMSQPSSALTAYETLCSYEPGVVTAEGWREMARWLDDERMLRIDSGESHNSGQVVKLFDRAIDCYSRARKLTTDKE